MKQIEQMESEELLAQKKLRTEVIQLEDMLGQVSLIQGCWDRFIPYINLLIFLYNIITLSTNTLYFIWIPIYVSEPVENEIIFYSSFQ